MLNLIEGAADQKKHKTTIESTLVSHSQAVTVSQLSVALLYRAAVLQTEERVTGTTVFFFFHLLVGHRNCKVIGSKLGCPLLVNLQRGPKYSSGAATEHLIYCRQCDQGGWDGVIDYLFLPGILPYTVVMFWLATIYIKSHCCIVLNTLIVGYSLRQGYVLVHFNTTLQARHWIGALSTSQCVSSWYNCSKWESQWWCWLVFCVKWNSGIEIGRASCRERV